MMKEKRSVKLPVFVLSLDKTHLSFEFLSHLPFSPFELSNGSDKDFAKNHERKTANVLH